MLESPDGMSKSQHQVVGGGRQGRAGRNGLKMGWQVGQLTQSVLLNLQVT